MIVMFVLPPRSRELVAVIDPAPDLVTRKTAPQSTVEADPTDTVATFVPGPFDVSITGALDVPVIVRVPVIVVVTP